MWQVFGSLEKNHDQETIIILYTDSLLNYNGPIHFQLFRYLRCVRTSVNEDAAFINSTIWAEMKKATTYRVDVKLNHDGVIDETQCECAVGQGPDAHCKHVGTVLYSLVRFTLDSTVLTELTCTQVISEFMDYYSCLLFPVSCIICPFPKHHSVCDYRLLAILTGLWNFAIAPSTLDISQFGIIVLFLIGRGH